MSETFVICSNCHRTVKYDTEIGKPEKCKHCHSKYYNKPDFENKLFLIQDKFIENNRDSKYLAEMYPLLFLYCKKLLLKKLKGKLYFNSDQIEEKTNDTANKIMEYYLRDNSYIINSSFAGCIQFVLRDVLYNYKRAGEDNHYSLNVELDDKGNELLTNIVGLGYVDIYDEKLNVDDEFFKRTNEILLNIKYFLNSFIEGYIKFKNDDLSAYKIITGINHKFENRDDKFMNKYYSLVGRDIKSLIEWFYFVIYDYLINYKTVGDNIQKFFDDKIQLLKKEKYRVY